jgi:hypothetical protein
MIDPIREKWDDVSFGYNTATGGMPAPPTIMGWAPRAGYYIGNKAPKLMNDIAYGYQHGMMQTPMGGPGPTNLGYRAARWAGSVGRRGSDLGQGLARVYSMGHNVGRVASRPIVKKLAIGGAAAVPAWMLGTSLIGSDNADTEQSDV